MEQQEWTVCTFLRVMGLYTSHYWMQTHHLFDIGQFGNSTLLYEYYKTKGLSNANRHEWNVSMITINFLWPFAFKLIHFKTDQFSITLDPSIDLGANWTLKRATTHRFLWRVISSTCSTEIVRYLLGSCVKICPVNTVNVSSK